MANQHLTRTSTARQVAIVAAISAVLFAITAQPAAAHDRPPPGTNPFGITDFGQPVTIKANGLSLLNSGPMPAIYPQWTPSWEAIIDVIVIKYASGKCPSQYTPGCVQNKAKATNDLRQAINEGSKWLGTGPASISITIKSFAYVYDLESPHIGNNYAAEGDVGAMLNAVYGSQYIAPYASVSACSLIAAATRPTWVWIIGDENSHLKEWVVQGPLFEAYTGGHNVPLCGNKQFVVFGFSSAYSNPPGSSNWSELSYEYAHHDVGHYMEWLLNNAARFGYPEIGCNALNPTGGVNGGNAATQYQRPSSGSVLADLYECPGIGKPLGPANNFMARSRASNGAGTFVGRGDIHFPCTQAVANDLVTGPYIYNNPATASCRANNWWDESGSYQNVSGATWGNSQGGYMKWWFQGIPGSSTTSPFNHSVSSVHYGWYGLWWLGQ